MRAIDQLPIRQQRFVLEWMVDKVGKAAAIRAGYKESHAAVTASQLLRKPLIKAAIEEEFAKQQNRTRMNADAVLLELARIAQSDVRQAFNDDGTLKPITEMPEELARAISSVEIDELYAGVGDTREMIGYTKKIKFWDKNKALDNLGKHFKLFVERFEIEDKTGLADKMKKARERAINGRK